MEEQTRFTEDEAHLHFAKALNGETWKLLANPERTREQDERMLAAAFGSYYHWLCAGAELNKQRGEYLIARVYLALGNVPEALAHAESCLELTERFRDQMHDFDLAYAYEIYARANAAAGELYIAREYHTRAVQAGEQIQDPEDRAIFDRDLKGGKWYGVDG